MGLPVQLPCGSVLLGGVSTIRSTALRLRFFMAAPPVLAVRCWDGISEFRRNSEASAQLLEASEVLTKITVLGRLSVISMRRSAEIMQQRRTAVAAVKSGVAPQRISNILEIKTVGFARKTYRFCVIARFVQKRNVDSARKRLHTAKNVCFPNKDVSNMCHCEAAARPWQSLSQRYGIPWRSTGVETKTAALSQNHEIRCFVSLPLSFRVLFRSVQPYFVPGCRFVPFKIAASLSLLAMTNLVGFAEKRNNFWSETFERR